MEEEREIWLDREQDLLDVNDFYGDIPPLPYFPPCMPSSSTPVLIKPMVSSLSFSSASTSSSAASWAILKSDADDEYNKKNNHDYHYHYHYQHNHDASQYDQIEAHTATLSSTASMEISQPLDRFDQGIESVDCMNMENFRYMDLIENNDFFDSSSIYQDD